MTRLDETALRAFLWGRTLHSFDPDSRALVASITYGRDGTCRAEFADGTRDEGRFGLVVDTYWTRYARFRGGETHGFYLEPLSPDTAQARHADGRRAFLQSHRPVLDDGAPGAASRGDAP